MEFIFFFFSTAKKKLKVYLPIIDSHEITTIDDNNVLGQDILSFFSPQQ